MKIIFICSAAIAISLLVSDCSAMQSKIKRKSLYTASGTVIEKLPDDVMFISDEKIISLDIKRDLISGRSLRINLTKIENGAKIQVPVFEFYKSRCNGSMELCVNEALLTYAFLKHLRICRHPQTKTYPRITLEHCTVADDAIFVDLKPNEPQPILSFIGNSSIKTNGKLVEMQKVSSDSDDEESLSIMM